MKDVQTEVQSCRTKNWYSSLRKKKRGCRSVCYTEEGNMEREGVDDGIGAVVPIRVRAGASTCRVLHA